MKTRHIRVDAKSRLALAVLLGLVQLPLPGLAKDLFTFAKQRITAAGLISFPGALNPSGRDRSAAAVPFIALEAVRKRA